MTVWASSTGSTIEPQSRPDRRTPRETPPRASPAAIVASLHARTGKTLLARVLADYFVLSGDRPLLFDTDAAEQMLHASFPYDTVVVDVGEVRDQMTLFDTLAARSPEARVVDVSHHVFRKFFRVMQDSHFVAEARTRHVEPVLFYITDRNPDAYEEARLLRERFEDCALVLVENAYIGGVKELTRRSAAYRTMQAHDLRMTLPRLDPALADAIEDRNVSLSEIMSRPLSRGDTQGLGGLSFEQTEVLRGFLVKTFREIHRAFRAAEMRAPPLLPTDEW